VGNIIPKQKKFFMHMNKIRVNKGVKEISHHIICMNVPINLWTYMYILGSVFKLCALIVCAYETKCEDKKMIPKGTLIARIKDMSNS
jgi:hypothetical protein